jgi:hypothetical protein
LTVFIDRTKFEPDLSYFMIFDSKSGTGLFNYEPDPYRSVFEGPALGDVIGEDRTTQIEVILGRIPSRNLFRFHTGRELEDHHVKWNREGELTGDDDID